MPMVSVVIPTHNRCELLRRTLRSVLWQRDIDLEVLVVDDGSRDGTAEVLQALDDPRVRVLRNERPVRVAAARNQGIRMASGAWIALLDDDDLWSPEKLRAQVIAAEAAGRRWVYAGYVEIDGGGNVIGGGRPPSPDQVVAAMAASNVMPAGCSNVMIHADLLGDTGGFDTGLRHLADWDLWLRLLHTGPPACVPRPLVAYRIHAAQASLDPTGMIAEGRVLQARHGADLNSIRRWLAWSRLRRGERMAAARAYVGAAVAGDVLSLGRAAVALLHPHPTAVRAGQQDTAWQHEAGVWLHALSAL